MASPEPYLVDEILEDIFLRLPTLSALACASFHRIITDRSFLRRFRKIHPPPLLGFATDEGAFHPAEDPHPSAPLARALVDAADFSYCFVPKPNDNDALSPWRPRDVRDGRVLLGCSPGRWRPPRFGTEIEAVFTNLAVCDPLSRRYVLLAPIPDEMTAHHERLLEFAPLLAPIGEDEDETSFKVICAARYESKLVAFVFSSVTGQWCIATSTSWSSLGTVEPSWNRLYHLSCVNGCFYWADLWRDKLLVLDAGMMEFSTVNFRNQPVHTVDMSTIVAGTKGALEMLTLAGDITRASSLVFYLYHTAQQDNGEFSNDCWQLKNVKDLTRGGSLCHIMGAAEGFLFLHHVRDAQQDDNAHGLFAEDSNLSFCSLEVKTFDLNKVCRATFPPDCIHSYFGFPPSLSQPSL